MKAGCLAVIVVIILLSIIGSCMSSGGSGSSSNPCRDAGFSASDCSKGMRELQRMK
ncbi:hypothetical protein PAENIP36_08040 [Paenibacillus sp. P36]